MLRTFCSKLVQQSVKRKACIQLASAHLHSSNYGTQYEGLTVELKDKVVWIKFNRPDKHNALTIPMYKGVTDVLERVNRDDNVKALVLTGNGDYYSSGNDLKNLTDALQDEGGPKAGMTKAKDLLIKYVDSFIHLEKLLIAAVNGPSIGIAATTLGFCDYILASNKSLFHTPFTALGQCPEACSSFTFPQIVGSVRANELLLLNQKWSASEAHSCGLVSKVVEHEKLYPHLDEMLYGKQGLVATCYPNSLRVCKSLIRTDETKKMLSEINRKESETIFKLWLSEESMEAAQKFMTRSKK